MLADRPEEEAASSRAVTPTIEEEPGQSGIIDMASVLFVFIVFQFTTNKCHAKLKQALLHSRSSGNCNKEIAELH